MELMSGNQKNAKMYAESSDLAEKDHPSYLVLSDVPSDIKNC